MKAKLFGALVAVMIVPAAVAGVLGTLKLALVVGILSIFVGLLGASVLVSRWESFQRRTEPPRLPKARLLD